MRPIEQVHQQILAGNILDSSGRWIPRTEALRRKRSDLKHLFKGEVKIDGKWITLSSLTTTEPSEQSSIPASPPDETINIQYLKKNIAQTPQDKYKSQPPQLSPEKTTTPHHTTPSSDPHATGGSATPATESYDNLPQNPDTPPDDPPAKQTVTIRSIPLGKDTILTISESRAGNTLVAICSIQGFIDQTNAEDLNTQIMSMLDFGVKFFIIDFEHTNLIGSAGWGVLAVAARLIKAAQGHLLICSMSKDIEESFLLLQFNEVIDARATISECLDFIDNCSVKPHYTEDQDGPKTGVFPYYGESFEDIPLPEKIKTIISRSGPIGFFAIHKTLQSIQYGTIKINYLRLFMLLRELNLESKWKRVRFYRSC